ncbi:MAG: N-acetyltransferase [Anaerolineales bacterium]|nr:N-acetyltransferase [Anaerolineae bacterium]PWB68779.1 MAG: N-acetyltransferase [Anaerolineales bacterium]
MTEPFVHASSYVDKDARVGAGTRIWHFCHVMSNARIGERCIIGQNVFVAADVQIGNNVKIQNNVSLYTGVIVEDDVFLGPSMVFTNVVNPRSHVNRKNEYKTTLVKKGASIGANATILCGITLGRYCFIGAGAVVTRDVPNYALVYGNPARIKGWICQCGIELSFSRDEGSGIASCEACGQQYKKNGATVSLLGETT